MTPNMETFPAAVRLPSLLGLKPSLKTWVSSSICGNPSLAKRMLKGQRKLDKTQWKWNIKPKDQLSNNAVI